MKRIIILLIGLISAAQAQFAPTSARTRFANGIAFNTRDTSAYNNADSLVVVINRQGRMMYRSTDGLWKYVAINNDTAQMLINYLRKSDTANMLSPYLRKSDTLAMLSPYARTSSLGIFVPYSGAAANLDMGTFRISSRSAANDSILARSSAGGVIATNSGTAVASYGAGGSAEMTFNGFAGYNSNRSGSFTDLSFVNKKWADSLLALKLNISDSLIYFSQVVRTFGPQTIGGAKTFTGAFNATSPFNYFGINNDDGYLYIRGWNNSTARFISQTGVSTVYNGLLVSSNPDNNNTLPRWDLDLGGNDGATNGNLDGFELRRRPTSGGAFSSMFRINNLGETTTNKLGLGTNLLTGYNLRLLRNLSGNPFSISVSNETTVQSDVTTQANNYFSSLSTQSASFTLPIFSHFRATQGTIGAGSAVTNQTAFEASANLTAGTSLNIGFRGRLNSAAGSWNNYHDGTANNYYNGRSLFGTPIDNGLHRVQVNGGIRVTGELANSGVSITGGTTVTRLNAGNTSGGLSHNIDLLSGNVKDNNAIPAWSLLIGGTTTSDRVRISRAPSVGNTLTELFSLDSTGNLIITGGVTSQRGRFTSLVVNKDSIPITTSNFWVATIDTSGTPGTNRVNRRGISAVHTGSIAFDTSSRTLTINQISGGTTSVVIPRGTASGTSGITALSSTRTGNLVTVSGDNGSSTIFSVRDADSSSPLQSLTASYGISGSPYNGTSALTWLVDTAAISTKANVTALLNNYTTLSQNALKLNISDTSSMLSNYNRKSDTASMLSNYRRSSTLILNSNLANSTISGIALGGNLNNHLNGYGISGTAYNGALNQTWLVDTVAISTKANVTALLLGKQNVLSGTSTQVPYFTGTNTLSSSSNFTWDNSLNRLKAKSIFIDSAETLVNEDDALYIETSRFKKNIGRGIKTVLNWGDGAEAYGSTAIEGQSKVYGNNPKDHSNVFQSFSYKEGTGRMQYMSNFYASKILSNSNIGKYYGYYYNSGTGTPDSAWSFFSVGADPAYISSKLAIADSTLPNSSIPYPLFVSKPFGNSTNGFTTAQAGIYSNGSWGVGIGGVLALGGKSGLASDPYPFAFIRGAKEDLTTYGGFLSLHTTSDGSNSGEVNGGNYERMRINKKGQVTVGDSVTLGSDIKFSVVGGKSFFQNIITDVTAGGNVLYRKNNVNVMAQGVKSGIIGNDNGAITYVYGANPYDIYVNDTKRWGIDSLGYQRLFTTPVTSTSGFDILTRNSSTGRTEIISSTSTGTDSLVRAVSPTITLPKLNFATLDGNAVVTSSQPATTFTINNTGSNFGSNIQLQRNGVTNGYFGTVGALLGNSDLSLAAYATSGNNFKVFTNGNNLRLTVDTNITATNAFAGKKIIGNSSAPSVALGANITGSVSVTGTDLAGTVTVTVTSVSGLATLNELFTLTYNTAYSSTPHVVWSPSSPNAAALLQAAGGLYLKNSSTSLFQIAIVNSYTTPGSATYSFTYHVIQ